MNASLDSPLGRDDAPKRRRMAWLGVLSAAVATVALSGCWDDSDDNTASTTPPPAPVPAPAPSPSGEVFSGTVPASAGASPQAFVSYVAALQNNDTIEPLDISTITTPPEDNTDEPVAVNTAAPAVAPKRSNGN